MCYNFFFFYIFVTHLPINKCIIIIISHLRNSNIIWAIFSLLPPPLCITAHSSIPSLSPFSSSPPALYNFFFFTFSSYQIIYILMFCKTRLFLDWRWRLKIRSLVPRHIFCKSETSNINSTANFLPKIMCSRCFVITEPDA